jgi:hypothetical protein
MHSRHQNLPEASQGDHKMYLTHLEQVCCCLGLQAGAAMPTALLVLLVLNAYALIDQQLQQTTINHSTLNSTTTHATPHCGCAAHPLPVALGKLACVNLQGGWLPPSPPAIAINVRNYAPFEMWFASATALQTTRVQTTLASQISQNMLFIVMVLFVY